MSFEQYNPYVCPISSAFVWRNDELSRTDILVAIPDHPQRAALLTYRADLRAWPSTDSFPDTRPEVS
jgi:hypothetical protein